MRGKGCTSLEDIEVGNYPSKNQQIMAREKAEAVLLRLQVLKGKVAELRLQYEELRKQRMEEHSTGPLCSKCGNSIESGHEIVVKGSDGTVRACYHQECF